MSRSCNGRLFFLAPCRSCSLALAAAGGNFISGTVLRSLFDWHARFSIWSCVLRRSEVAATSIVSVLAVLAP